MASVIIRVEDGDTIESVVNLAHAVAKATSRTLQFNFNDFPVLVGPNHLPEAVVKDYIKRVSTYKEDN